MLDILDEVVFYFIAYTSPPKKRQVFSNVGIKSLNKECNKLTKLKSELKKLRSYMEDWIFLSKTKQNKKQNLDFAQVLLCQ